MNPENKQSVIIVAGGKGVRAGGELPKQFQPVGSIPVLMHAIQAFYRYSAAMHIVVVLPDGFQPFWKELCAKHHFNVPHKVVSGRETRFDSVKNGLKEVADEGTVGVHDAVRPFVSTTLIAKCFETAQQHYCGVIPVVEEINSVRLLTEDGSRVIDRKLLKVIQTPQVFPAASLKRAYETAAYDPAFTDDASVAEKQGVSILLIDGEESNIKITTPFDWIVAESWYHHFIKTTE